MSDWRTNWRITSYRPMFWKMDGALAPIIFILLMIFIVGQVLGFTLWKVLAMIFILPIFFAIIQRRGYDIPTFIRAVHYRLVGFRARGGRKPKYRRD